MASPVLFLAFGDRRLEVLSAAGFDSVCQQAEAALSLHPQSYEIYDACGKVDAYCFDRSLASSRGGLCVLELREKPEWQKMRQMEIQIQQLQRDEDLKAEVERQVAAQLETAMATFKAELRKDLEMGKMDGLDIDSLTSRVASLETDLAEHLIDSSADLGRVEAGLITAQQELDGLRSFTADQLSQLEKFHLENMSAIDRIDKLGEVKMEEMTVSFNELSQKISAMEIDLNEQTITASAVNGHLESGVATAKQELESLRHCMAEQLNFMNSKVEKMETEERPPKTLGQTIAWSDGFKSHELANGPLYGKMGKVLWQSAPTLTTLKRTSKSLPQLPPL